MSAQRITECFIRIQQHRHLCWLAVIGKKPEQARIHAVALARASAELSELLAQ